MHLLQGSAAEVLPDRRGGLPGRRRRDGRGVAQPAARSCSSAARPSASWTGSRATCWSPLGGYRRDSFLDAGSSCPARRPRPPRAGITFWRRGRSVYSARHDFCHGPAHQRPARRSSAAAEALAAIRGQPYRLEVAVTLTDGWRASGRAASTRSCWNSTLPDSAGLTTFLRIQPKATQVPIVVLVGRDGGRGRPRRGDARRARLPATAR